MVRHPLDAAPVIEATRVAETTLVGTLSNSFPLPSGNCFGVEASDGKGYRILNFVYENLQELLKRGMISFPIKILVLAEHNAVLHDDRIPDDWYLRDFCESCTPCCLLPLHQRLRQLRAIARGTRTEKPCGGKILVSEDTGQKAGLIQVPYTVRYGEVPSIEEVDERYAKGTADVREGSDRVREESPAEEGSSEEAEA